MSISPEILAATDDMLRARYSDRYHRFQHDPRTLGWDTAANQRLRFAVAAESLALSRHSILDVGCGLGDFCSFMAERDPDVEARYTGIDINPDLLGDCRRRLPRARFEQRNLLLDPAAEAVADMGVMFGVLNFRFRDFDNEDFARGMIAAAFAACRDGLAVDMLSARHDPAYPAEDFVYYYDPLRMLDWALSLTPHVILRHDYASIPQREFMLVLRHRPWPA